MWQSDKFWLSFETPCTNKGNESFAHLDKPSVALILKTWWNLISVIGTAMIGHKYIFVIRYDHSRYTSSYLIMEVNSQLLFIYWCAPYGHAQMAMADGPAYYRNKSSPLLEMCLKVRHYFIVRYCPWSNKIVDGLKKNSVVRHEHFTAMFLLSFFCHEHCPKSSNSSKKNQQYPFFTTSIAQFYIQISSGKSVRSNYDVNRSRKATRLAVKIIISEEYSIYNASKLMKEKFNRW